MVANYMCVCVCVCVCVLCVCVCVCVDESSQVCLLSPCEQRHWAMFARHVCFPALYPGGC